MPEQGIDEKDEDDEEEDELRHQVTELLQAPFELRSRGAFDKGLCHFAKLGRYPGLCDNRRCRPADNGRAKEDIIFRFGERGLWQRLRPGLFSTGNGSPVRADWLT